MKTQVARDLALGLHGEQTDRFGQPLVHHLARVAAAVPPRARPLAWLHDAFERTPVTAAELRAVGLTVDELGALELLSRTPPEAYELYILRIARADGRAGDLARRIKLADLQDHIDHGEPSEDAPPYAWAHRRILRAQARTAGDARGGTRSA